MERNDILWDMGYRPYEIYVYNDGPVEYCGKTCGAGTVSGWDIKHVFAKREHLRHYPFFDAVICLSDMSVVSETFQYEE